MKFLDALNAVLLVVSHPSRGEWIEIDPGGHLDGQGDVSPLAG